MEAPKRKNRKSHAEENKKGEKGNREEVVGKEYHDKKAELVKLLRRVKRGETCPDIYRKRRKEYKWWIKRKKEKWADRQLEEIMKDKSERKFWEKIKSSRSKREDISKEIKGECWKEHFKRLFNGVKIAEENEAIEGQERWSEEAIMEEEIE